jgi:hypothetical protein
MNTIKMLFGRLLLFLLLAGGGAARAQYQVRVNTITIPPLGSDLDEMFGASPGGHFLVMLSAATATAGAPYVKIAGTLECLSPSSFTISLSQNFRPAAPIVLGGAGPTTLTPAELAEAFGNFIPGNLVAQGISLNNLLNTGGGLHYQLPEGTYRLCITAYSYDVAGYTKPISDPNTGCTTFTVCYKASAPQFVLPVNTLSIPSDIPVINPSYPVQFTWTAPNTTCGAPVTPLTYTLEIHQIFQGQSPQDALNNPPVFTKPGLPSVVFPFDTLLYPNILQRGQQYAIRVRASSNANALANLSNVVFANNGYSTVGAFQYGNAYLAPVAVLVPGVDLNGGASPPANPSVGAANCGLIPPSNTSPIPPGTPLAGSALSVAGFTLTPDNTIQQNSDGTWSGAGTITWKPFGNPIAVYVTYSHIGINTDKTVYNGTVSASMDPSAFAGQSFGQWTNFTQQSGSQLDQLASTVQNYIQEAGHLANQISGGSPVYLPLGLNQTIAGQPANLAIMSMAFSARGATMNVLFDVGVPEANGSLTLAGMNICISSTGSNFSQGTVLLPVNRSFDIGSGGNNLTITFQGCGNMDSTKGTYATWSGGQFSNVVAHAQISFPQNAIVPDNNGSPGSGTVVGSAIFQFSSWENWVASISLPNFEIAGVAGIGIQTSTVYFDHSTTQNAPGFSFPDNYPNPDGTAFEGLYVPSMQVLLPSNFRSFNQGSQRTSFGAQNLVLDDDGVSADLTGSHIIDISTGDLGGWAFSLDNLQLLVVQNNFQSGSFSGSIRLPVSSSNLAYSGDFHVGNGPLQYSFLVQPAGNISFDIWAAQVNLDASSNISVGQDAQGTAISATLNGGINIVLSSGTPNINFQAMSFQGLSISNRNAQGQQGFRFNEGTWSFASSENVAGFPVSINNLTPVVDFSNLSNVKLGVQFDLNINIGLGDASVVSATTNLTVFGTLNVGNINQPPKILTGGGIQVDSVAINGDVGPLSLQGYLSFYNQNNTYGNGLKGHAMANFQIVQVQATVQFGNVNNYNYWYVDACVNFPVIPIVPSPFGFSGFGGGAYYNMTMSPNLPSDPNNLHAASNANNNTAGATMSGVTYTPSQGTAGISATVCFATVGTADGMNANLTLTGQITNGAFSGIDLNGNMYALTNYPSNSAAIVQGSVDIQIDFAHPTFSLTASLQGNWGVSFDVPLSMYVGSNGWYFKLGDPFGQRVSVQLINHQDPVTQFSVVATAYFEMGSLISNQLPPPQTPNITIGSEAQTALNSIINQSVTNGLNTSLGMMFGADVTASFKFTFACIYASVTGGVGFDLEIANYQNGALCTANAGWNSWYATGQFYAYLTLDVGISVDVWFAHGNFSLVTFSLACDFTAGAPNPTWVSGSVDISGSIFNGWISFNQSVNVQIGQQCYGTPPDPLTNAKIISGYGPQGNADVFVYPYVTTNLALNQPLTLNIPPSQGSPQGSTVTYQFDISSFTITGGGKTINAYKDYENNNTTVVFRHNDMLLPNTTYTVTAVCTVQQLIPDAGDPSAGAWGTPLNAQGQPQNENETTTFTFTTGPAPTTIVQNNVANTYPVNRQRYVLKNDLASAGLVQLDEWQDNVFTLPQATNYPNSTVVENETYFIDCQGGDTIRSSFTTNKGTNRINFSLPASLKNETTYRLEFWEVREALPGLRMGSQSTAAVTPTEHVDTTTSTLGRGGNRLNLKFANRTVSGNYEAPAPMPSNEIYTLYFRTSRFNTFSDKINAWGSWSGSRSGRNVLIQNSGGFLGESFDQIEINGYTSPDGNTNYPPLFEAGIDWQGNNVQNDAFANLDLYANGLILALNYKVSVNYGATAVREGNGLLVAPPVHSLDWSGFYADPPLSSAEMPPVGEPSAAPSASKTGPRSLGMAANNYTSTSAGALFTLPKTVMMANGKGSGGGTPSRSVPLKMGGSHNMMQGMTYQMVWSRDYYLYEDWVLLQVAGLVGAIEQAECDRSYISASQQQSLLNQVGGTFTMATNDIGGSISMPYSQFYYLYSNPNGAALLQTLKNLTFTPFPGGTRNVHFWYSAANLQSGTVTKNFTVK